MAAAVVDFVVTEHRPAITRALERHYEEIRERLERLAGVPVRSQHYCDAENFAAAAVVLSGSFAPWAQHDARALDRFGERVRRFGGAVLGICAGMQLLTVFAGGAIGPREHPAVGFAAVEVLDEGGLLGGLGPTAVTYEHHSWDVVTLPEDFQPVIPLITLAGVLVLTLLVIRGPLRRATRIQPGTALRYQ